MPDGKRLFKRFCSRACQDIYVKRSEAGRHLVIEPTHNEQAAMEAVLPSLGDYVASVGIDRPLSAYTRDEVLGLVDVVLTAYFDSLRELLSCSVSSAEKIGGSIVVLDYELEDVMAPGLGGKPPGSKEVERRTQWLSEYVPKRIGASQRYTLLPIQNISGEYEKLKNSTGVIHRCGSCVVDIGKAVGAKYVLVGWVQRFSNLIIKFQMLLWLTPVGLGEIMAAGAGPNIRKTCVISADASLHRRPASHTWLRADGLRDPFVQSALVSPHGETPSATCSSADHVVGKHRRWRGPSCTAAMFLSRNGFGRPTSLPLLRPG